MPEVEQLRTGAISFDISIIEKVAKDFDLSINILEEGMRQALEVLQGEIVKRIPTGATGNAGRSTQIRMMRHPGEINGYVYSDNPYMGEIEDGRQPGKFPPFGHVSTLNEKTGKYEKVKRKVTRTNKKAGAKTTHEYNINSPLFAWVKYKTDNGLMNLKEGETVAQLAFLVARKIANEGTRAQRPFALGFFFGENAAQIRFEKAVADMVASL